MTSKIACIILAIGTCHVELYALPAPQGFHWDWRESQELVARESLRNAKLASRDKEAIAAAIEGQLRQQISDFGPESTEQLRKAAMDTRIKVIDLNADNIPEVVAQGMVDCGATGNCPFWVFQKTPPAYKLLLKSYGQTFTIQKTSTNGFRDIVVSSRSSATKSGLADYRYENGTYHDTGNYCADWTREVKEPRITSCGNQ